MVQKNVLAYSEGGDPAIRAGLLLTLDRARDNQAAYAYQSQHPLGIDTGRPATWSWRDVDGTDHSTPVRDQGATSACVAFALAAVLETELKRTGSVESFTPGLDVEDRHEILEQGPDLSEADLFFKRGRLGISGQGWFIEDAIMRARDHGVCLEKHYPFDPSMDDSIKLKKDGDLSTPRVYLTSAYKTSDIEVAKTLLWQRGPLVAGIDYRGSLVKYRKRGSITDLGGLDAHYERYEFKDPETGPGHLVAIMGYQDLEPQEAKEAGCQGFWIAKNSWGKDWGYDGWFKVPYAEAPLGDSSLGVKTGFFSLALGPTAIPGEGISQAFLERLEVFVDVPENIRKLQGIRDLYLKRGGATRIKRVWDPSDEPPK